MKDPVHKLDPSLKTALDLYSKLISILRPEEENFFRLDDETISIEFRQGERLVRCDFPLEGDRVVVLDGSASVETEDLLTAATVIAQELCGSTSVNTHEG